MPFPAPEGVSQSSAGCRVLRLKPWHLPSTTLILRRDEVHVWRVALNVTASRKDSLRQILSDEEHRRAARFHFQRDREHFIVARGMLRVILARYLTVEPRQLRFCYGPHGKPALASEYGVDAVCFNSSHSHELLLCAVTRGRAIGVDVEHVRGSVDAEEIAERFFSPKEIATLRSKDKSSCRGNGGSRASSLDREERTRRLLMRNSVPR